MDISTSPHLLLDRLLTKLRASQEESPTAYYWTLLDSFEFSLKYTVATFLAAVEDERNRHSYRLCHRLVRASGIGEWNSVLDDLLTGPASQHLDNSLQAELEHLSQRSSPNTWQYKATQTVHRAAEVLGLTTEKLPTKVSLRRMFADFVLIRNKTRGHGIHASTSFSGVSPLLQEALNLVVEHFSLFARSAAYLRRNLSGKYRVTQVSGDGQHFSHLKRSNDINLSDGLYVALSDLRRVPLLFCEADLSDVFLPNGGFGEKQFELISYFTGDRQHHSSSQFLQSPDPLPSSESEGLDHLAARDRAFANVPVLPARYIQRASLEADLMDQLMLDRHPIITLSGPGGIGKTWLALKVLNRVVAEHPRFELVVWFSARDIDLLFSGPKPVQPHVLSIDDFANEYVRLTEPQTRGDKQFAARTFFANELGKCSYGPAVFVFDNFETVKNPADIFEWIDTYVRLPNKVIITTRRREFAGDFPIRVAGMTEEEFDALVDATSSRLGLTGVISDQFRDELFQETGGHPYLINIILGQVAKTKTLRKVERAVAQQDAVLNALFERTFVSLTPAAQRVFLTLCNWRAAVPAIALEAVLLRPSNEWLSFRDAVDEAVNSSLVEEVFTAEGGSLLFVPLAALLFGRKKIETSPYRSSIQADSTFLQLLGTGQTVSGGGDAERRLNRMFKTCARQVGTGEATFEHVCPILEFISGSYKAGWLLLAQMREEDGPAKDLVAAREYTRKYLEEVGPQGADVSRLWRKLADLCRDTGDWLGEIHAIASIATSEGVPSEVVSSCMNRINGAIKGHGHLLQPEELKLLLGPVIAAANKHKCNLSADDLSRLAWLHMNCRDEWAARSVALEGLELDSENPHCASLIRRIDFPLM